MRAAAPSPAPPVSWHSLTGTASPYPRLYSPPPSVFAPHPDCPQEPVNAHSTQFKSKMQIKTKYKPCKWDIFLLCMNTTHGECIDASGDLSVIITGLNLIQRLTEPVLTRLVRHLVGGHTCLVLRKMALQTLYSHSISNVHYHIRIQPINTNA